MLCPEWAAYKIHSEQIDPFWQSKQKYRASYPCSEHSAPFLDFGGLGIFSSGGAGAESGTVRAPKQCTVSASREVVARQISH